MPDMKSKILDWSKVKKWVDDTFSLNTHDHDDVYSKLGHTHDDTVYNSMPDFSRAVSIGAQEAWKSRTSECYAEPGTNKTVLGGCPYVLKCVTPCYIFITWSSTSTDDDAEWSIWFGKNRNHVICCNRADSDYSYRSVAARLTSANGFDGVSMGSNLFLVSNYPASDANNIGFPMFQMSMKDWWYRPLIGGGGSNNENWEYWDFKLIPCIGTPSNTILAERYQFTADNSKSTLLNTNPVYGTMSGDNNIITYYNKDDISKATASMTITRPGIIRAK